MYFIKFVYIHFIEIVIDNNEMHKHENVFLVWLISNTKKPAQPCNDDGKENGQLIKMQINEIKPKSNM